jgi:hypothetical protein
LPVEDAAELSIFFAGLKRTCATEKQTGERKVNEGRQPLEFSAYRKLCMIVLQRAGKGMNTLSTFLF